VRRELIAATLITLVGCHPVFAQVGGMASPTPGMGLTTPFGMSVANGSVGPTGVPLGATEIPTPGISPTPSGSLGAGSTICSGVIGAATNGVIGLFDGGGVGTAAGTSQAASTCSQTNQASDTSSVGNGQLTTSSVNSAGPLGIGTIPMGSIELSNGGVSPAPCPLIGATLPTSGSATTSGAC
jgi:hypothetical protein